MMSPNCLVLFIHDGEGVALSFSVRNGSIPLLFFWFYISPGVGIGIVGKAHGRLKTIARRTTGVLVWLALQDYHGSSFLWC